MRMTDKILITLRDLSNEQKSILSGKFIEQSKWLESELQSLKNLILQDPRENFQLTQTIKTAVEETDEIPAPSSSMPERNQAQKRKSPEVALSLIRDSPEQKRSTPNIEWENVATHFGVPSDLNKLKKEELLVMLEGYGIYSQSMKDYKKDIMNALKNHLELEYCSSIRNGNGIGNENVNGADMFTESHEIVRLEPEPQRSQEQIEEKSKIPSQPKEEDLAIPVTSSQEQNVQVSAEEEVKLEPTMESIPDVDNHTLSPMETQPSEIEVAENSNAIIVETLKPYVDQMLAKKPPVVPVKNSGFVDKPIIVSVLQCLINNTLFLCKQLIELHIYPYLFM